MTATASPPIESERAEAEPTEASARESKLAEARRSRDLLIEAGLLLAQERTTVATDAA